MLASTAQCLFFDLHGSQTDSMHSLRNALAFEYMHYLPYAIYEAYKKLTLDSFPSFTMCNNKVSQERQ